MGYLFLVFGLLEFLGWFFFGEGLIGGWIYSLLNPSYPWLANFALFKNPFFALYMILPSAWLLQDQVRENALSRWSLMAHPNLKRITTILTVVCGLILAVLAWIILRYFINRWSFDSNFGNFLLFGSIILLTFFLQLVLMNLPVPQVIKQAFLGQDVVGLYALKHDQFVLEEVPGQTEQLTPIGRWWNKKIAFKDKQRLWFVFSEGTRHFAEENKSAEVGVLKINYSWWADVRSSPDKIRVSEIALSGIESTEHLQTRLHSDFIHQFREIITIQPKYQEMQRELKKVSSNNVEEFVQNTIAQEIISFAYSPEEAVRISSNSFTISIKIKGLCEELLREASASARGIEEYGGLYVIGFQINDLSLSPEIIGEITKFEESAKEQYKEWYNRRQTSIDNIITIIDKLDGNIPRAAIGNTIERLIDMTREFPTQRSVLPPAFRQNEVSDEWKDVGTGSPVGINIERILQNLEPKLKEALNLQPDTSKAIKSVIQDYIEIIQNSERLSIFAKDDLFENWLSSKRGKLKSGNAKDILREFIQEQMDVGNKITM